MPQPLTSTLHHTTLHNSLYCTAQYCTVLHCTALYCTVLHCTLPTASHYFISSAASNYTFQISNLPAIILSASSTTHAQRLAAQRSYPGILRATGSKDWLKSSPYLLLLSSYLNEVISVDSGISGPGSKSRGGVGASPGVQYLSPKGKLY